MIVYFGRPWNRATLSGMVIDTPVGEHCERCREVFTADSHGVIYAGQEGVRIYVHAECEALGFLGHDWGVCSCTGYDTTLHATALELWRRLGEKRVR